ncbi:hypothetical protein DPM13_16215 [Paracoccus mutanolyticus]|uniref:Uncharacterized protein n=1 Tax=Paracoccus mutanolyticus TaxID=1499308 RepID=A0ABN5M7S2_9RHOB|nr:hypothetical protein DPM13_16215 [Paracoccus mutanolyticus]
MSSPDVKYAIKYQGDYVKELIAETDYPSFDVDGACAAFYEWKHHKAEDIMALLSDELCPTMLYFLQITRTMVKTTMVKTTAICPQRIRPPRIRAPVGKRDGADQRIRESGMGNRKENAGGLPDTIGGK